jgi:hypothetical protein
MGRADLVAQGISTAGSRLPPGARKASGRSAPARARPAPEPSASPAGAPRPAKRAPATARPAAAPAAGAPAQPERTGASTPRSIAQPSGGPAAQGSWFLLGLLLWGWVVLPFLKGGMGEMRAVLRAKFFNRDKKGGWLP